MYQITTDRESFYAGSVEFCYALPSGSPQVVREEERGRATGVIYHGTAYNLPGHDAFEGAETAEVTEIGAAPALNGQRRRITELETALCEADMAAEEWRASLETALCELDGGE